MFDIYLRQGCRIIPIEFNSLNENLKGRLLMNHPGFLGLNITLQEAKHLFMVLRGGTSKALGEIVPVKYRDEAKIDFDGAFSIAEKYLLVERRSEKYVGLHFNEIKLYSYSPMYYIFVCGVKEWVDAGVHPGGLFATVDKLDGHLWTDEEENKLRKIYE